MPCKEKHLHISSSHLSKVISLPPAGSLSSETPDLTVVGSQEVIQCIPVNMSAAVWISLLTLVVGTTVTLIVAALHRKQMRQIELYRADPTVPLVPPPHPFTKFLRRNARHLVFIVNLGLNLSFLIEHLLSTTALTRAEVFSIALFTSASFFTILMYLMTWDSLQTGRALHRIIDVIEKIWQVIAEKD
jgi:hypothetical protein